MPRPLRVEFKNAWYHIMNRGIASQNIFLCDKHRKIFLSLLKEITEIYSVEIHAYCLMGNHYHLLLKTPLGNISKAMQHLSGVYTRCFNKIEKRDGALFKGRYKAIVVSGFEYLLDVSKYIHLNPVKANIAKKAENYSWSSYGAYIKKVDKLEWLYTEKILSYFEEPNEHAKYKKFVCQTDKQRDFDELYQDQDSHYPVILGNEQSKIILDRMVKQSIYSKKEDGKEYRICDRYALNDLHMIISAYYKIDGAQFSCKYKREFVLHKRIFMYIARKLCKYTLTEIAHFFGNITYSHVSRSVKQVRSMLRKNRQLQKDIANIAETIDRLVTKKSKFKV